MINRKQNGRYEHLFYFLWQRDLKDFVRKLFQIKALSHKKMDLSSGSNPNLLPLIYTVLTLTVQSHGVQQFVTDSNVYLPSY